MVQFKVYLAGTDLIFFNETGGQQKPVTHPTYEV